MTSFGRKKMLVLDCGPDGDCLPSGFVFYLNFEAYLAGGAPVLLGALRAIQGFAVGGEWGGAALMAVENPPKGKKAFYSSGVQVRAMA